MFALLRFTLAIQTALCLLPHANLFSLVDPVGAFNRSNSQSQPTRPATKA